MALEDSPRALQPRGTLFSSRPGSYNNMCGDNFRHVSRHPRLGVGLAGALVLLVFVGPVARGNSPEPGGLPVGFDLHCPASAPRAGTSWSGNVSVSPTILAPGRNATVSVSFENTGQADLTLWDVCVHVDWWGSGMWYDIVGKPVLESGAAIVGYVPLTAPDSVGTHLVSFQVLANVTPDPYPTMTNYTQQVDIGSPSSGSLLPLGFAVGFVIVAAVVAAVTALALSRQKRVPRSPPRAPPPPLP